MPRASSPPAPRHVLDASALLAYLQREPGFERVRIALEEGAIVSTVNLAEVYTRALAHGIRIDQVAGPLAALGLVAAPFTEDDARRSALLVPKVRGLRLSLADRSCLALGQRLDLPIITTDRAWRHVAGLRIEVIR